MKVQASYTGVTGFSSGIIESNDCTVRALANATGMDYTDAHALLKKHGRKDRRGANYRTFIGAYAEAGFEVVSVHGSTRSAGVAERIAEVEASKGCTLKNIMPKLQHGVYIVNITGHALAVVHGKVIDTFSSPAGKRVIAVFKKKS
jgi:hypothetical protein